MFRFLCVEWKLRGEIETQEGTDKPQAEACQHVHTHKTSQELSIERLHTFPHVNLES